MIIIKPHHFIDIIKLYGSGIEHFIPDEAFHHDFYRAANEIVNDLEGTLLQLTIHGDDICKPCSRFDGVICTDPLECIEGFSRKETYNQELDKRILSVSGLNTETLYSGRQLLTKLLNTDSLVFLVWKEEAAVLTNRRNELFQAGGKILLHHFSGLDDQS